MRTLITGGLVVDSTGRDPLPNGVVAIEGGRISAVGRPEEFSDPPGGVETIDASGCTVLPGLIDCHTHVLICAARSGVPETDAAIWGGSYLKAALRGGVTTIRDLGSRYQAIFSIKKGVESGWLVGPRMVIAGSAICITGGHGHGSGATEADGPDAVRRLARQQIKLGANVIKLMASGGVTTANESPNSSQLSVEEMRAAVEEAHKAGIPSTTHAGPTAAIKNALLAGIDCIEHGNHIDDECIELMLKGGVAYSPTLSIGPRIVEAGQYGIPKPFMVERARRVVEACRASFQRAMAAGLKLGMGTDCGSPWHPLGDVAYELELWVQAGMKPLAALRTATRGSAEICRVLEEVGTLESGKRADVLIVEGDATADISAMKRVRRVLRDGATVYDATLSESAPGLIGRPPMGPLPGWLMQ